MVKPWALAREKGIKITKYRIKHLEKHGNGVGAMQEKAILKKQERHQQLMKERDETAKRI